MLTVIMVLLALASVHLYWIWKQKLWGELAVSALIWGAATVYAALLAADIPLISPARAVIDLLNLIYDRF